MQLCCLVGWWNEPWLLELCRSQPIRFQPTLTFVFWCFQKWFCPEIRLELCHMDFVTQRIKNKRCLVMCVWMCVCRTDEGGRRKCGQYWPQEEGGQEVYGHIAVVNHRVDNHAHYNQTTLELHNTEVTHIHQFYIIF